MKFIKGWCYVNKGTGIPEPVEGMDQNNRGTRWWDGYSIFGTRAALLKNTWNKVPEGYRPQKIKIKISY